MSSQHSIRIFHNFNHDLCFWNDRRWINACMQYDFFSNGPVSISAFCFPWIYFRFLSFDHFVIFGPLCEPSTQWNWCGLLLFVFDFKEKSDVHCWMLQYYFSYGLRKLYIVYRYVLAWRWYMAWNWLE